MKKILQVCDRPGWAIDRLSKPVSQLYENVDMSYFWDDPTRFLATGYTSTEDVRGFDKAKIEDYDIVHFHRVESARMVVGKIRKINPDIRLILSIHTERDEKQEWEIFDDIICPTEYVLERMTKLHKNCHLVPYGIDLNRFHYSFAERPSNTVGFIGRVLEHKRFDILCQAALGAKLRVIGCGYIEHPAIFRKHFDPNKIDFVSMLPEKQLINIYDRMKMYVCLSKPNIETGPLPVMEAMACGVPVISTIVGWAKDRAEHERDIWFIEEKEIDNLSKILSNIIQREDILIRLRSNALRLISEFSIENYAKKLMEIYNK